MANRYYPKNILAYQYWAKVCRIVDGDTVDLMVSLGFDIQVHHRFRLTGIDTPEIFSARKGSPERAAGEAAKAFLESRIPPDTWIEVKVATASAQGKYGRWLGEIFHEGMNINQLLVDTGHARISPG